jgi:hypothetical protein
MVNLTAEEKDERIAHFCRTTGADATQVSGASLETFFAILCFTN